MSEPKCSEHATDLLVGVARAAAAMSGDLTEQSCQGKTVRSQHSLLSDFTLAMTAAEEYIGKLEKRAGEPQSEGVNQCLS